MHVVSLSFVASFSSTSLNTDIQPFCRSQIAGLIAKKAFTKVFNKYVNFADVFSLNLAFKLPEHTEINDHTIKLIDSKQPPYELIYSLKSIELKTLKVYIETSLANRFIRPSKLLAGASILFN